MSSKLCVTVTGRTMAELRQRRDAVTNADLVELRVDTVEDPSAAAALADRRTPVIFTCRAAYEGGHFRGSEDERHRLLEEAQQLGADYIDVEWQAGFSDLIDRRRGKGIVLSMHDFEGVPADLAARATGMRSTGAEVVKIAVMTHRLSESLALRPIADRSDRPTVLIAMGDAGIASRVLAGRFGSCWTYAGDGAAPGQVPASRLLDEFSFRRLSNDTAVYGVVGRPVMHSLSPAMHNAAFRAAQLDAVYLPLPAADFDDFLTFADQVAMVGASVTAPFKLAAFQHAAECDEAGRRVRAVNTLRRSDHRWVARNTDVAGFLAPLQACFAVRGRRAAILGAGGAARAVAEALQAAGAHVAIAARDRDRAAESARLMGATLADWPLRDGSWDILVNATPVGTMPDLGETPLPDGPFTGELVYDLVYNPPVTRLLCEAQRAGCRTIGGLEMLVAQAERQFEWWTGRQPGGGVMREAAVAALARMSSTLDSVPTAGHIGAQK